MNLKSFSCLLAVVLLASGCASTPDTSQRTERTSATLEAVPGFTGDKLGIEVEQVTPVEGGKLQAIDLNLPMEPVMVDRVEVLTPEGKLIEQQREAEIVPETDERGVGLRIYLSKRKNWEFRLRLIDLPED